MDSLFALENFQLLHAISVKLTGYKIELSYLIRALLLKKMFLKILQNSTKITCAGTFILKMGTSSNERQ